MRPIPILMLANALLFKPTPSLTQYAPPTANGRSEAGTDDQLGRLRSMTDASCSAVMERATGTVYDLATEHFIGTLSFG